MASRRKPRGFPVWSEISPPTSYDKYDKVLGYPVYPHHGGIIVRLKPCIRTSAYVQLLPENLYTLHRVRGLDSGTMSNVERLRPISQIRLTSVSEHLTNHTGQAILSGGF